MIYHFTLYLLIYEMKVLMLVLFMLSTLYETVLHDDILQQPMFVFSQRRFSTIHCVRD
jgi:hypothetical protein